MDLEKVREIGARVAQSYGLELVDVEFTGGAGKQGRNLRVTIERISRGQGTGDREQAEQKQNQGPSTPAATAAFARDDNPEMEAGDSAGNGSPEMEAGVTLEDCANVSREMSTILDVEDPVPGGEYMLEVSSPGLDRKLTRREEFERFVGSRMKLMTRDALGASETSKGNRHFEGRLEKFHNGTLTLDVTQAVSRKGRRSAGDKKTIEIAFDNVERANLVPEI